jgi:hypothetical protein
VLVAAGPDVTPAPKLFMERVPEPVGKGTWRIDDGLMRAAFATIEHTAIFGMRTVDVEGRMTDIGFMDPLRQRLVAAFLGVGRGAAYETLRSLTGPGQGIILNSVANSNSDHRNRFNEIARLYADATVVDGKYAEEVDFQIFFGAYPTGFELHRDAYDVGLLCLAGKKNFVTSIDGSAEAEHTLLTGEALRWRSTVWHKNWNPQRDWSFCLHLGVGPSIARDPERGVPVRYEHAKVQLVDFLGVLRRGAR